MSELQRIRAVRFAMRRRTLLRASLQTAGFGLAAMLLVLAGLGAGALAYGVLRPARGLRGDRAAARLVARLHPVVASDLVSAVELGAPEQIPHSPDTGGAVVSPALVRALQGSVAGVVEPLDARRLIPLQPAALALGVLLMVAATTGAALRFWPDLARGLRALAHR